MEDNKNMQTEQQETQQTEQQTEKKTEQQAPFTFDYEKLAEIVNGRQTATEDSVLKGYLKEQGLSKEEMKAAIESYKKQKAESTPDIGALQSDITKATQRALSAEMQNSALLMANDLGVDVKAMPYLVRMADVTEVVKNGMVDETVLKTKLQEIVNAIPSLKRTEQQTGFQVVGAETSQQNEPNDDELYKIFGVKKK